MSAPEVITIDQQEQRDIVALLSNDSRLATVRVLAEYKGDSAADFDMALAPLGTPPYPGGAAIIVDCMTDNRVRTVAEVRHAFSKYGGNLGTDGSVAFQFKHCGQLVFAPGTDEDKVMDVALESGAEDVITDEDGAIEVLTSPPDFEAVKAALEAAGLVAEIAGVTMRAENTVALAGDDAQRMQKLLDVIEDLDDVQDVYHNAELGD